MALLRLRSIFALGALASCGQAGAQASTASSGITPPAGWQALPEVAKAASDAAKADGVTVASEAWGETARGCYAVWLKVSGGGVAVEQVLAGIASETIDTTDVVKPATEDGTGILSLAFTSGAYKGRLRARVEASAITALACFANEREPIACESACSTLLGSLP